MTHFLLLMGWISENLSLDWQTEVVVPLFKNGDWWMCPSYWGVTLLSLPCKVYAGVLKRRIQVIAEPQIQEEHCRFQPGHEKLYPHLCSRRDSGVSPTGTYLFFGFGNGIP